MPTPTASYKINNDLLTFTMFVHYVASLFPFTSIVFACLQCGKVGCRREVCSVTYKPLAIQYRDTSTVPAASSTQSSRARKSQESRLSAASAIIPLHSQLHSHSDYRAIAANRHRERIKVLNKSIDQRKCHQLRTDG